MTRIHHINCGLLRVEGYPTVVCHCLLLEDPAGLALVDTGIGLREVADPVGRLGQELIDGAGFQFEESETAVRKIERLGLDPGHVRHVVLTHADPDHVGGLADFPEAEVHVAREELDALQGGAPRYVPRLFDHRPHWAPAAAEHTEWFGLPSRPLPLGFQSEVRLVPLVGHTLGHCGVAVEQPGGWVLHAGDAYYLRVELTEDDHPVSAFAASRAEDDAQRKASLIELRRLRTDHADAVTMIGYHDISELPTAERRG